MHPSTVFPLHCGIYLSESTGNMEKYESLICLHLCERKKRGLFLSHGKLHQTVVFGNIKTYRDIEAFKFTEFWFMITLFHDFSCERSKQKD